MYQAPLKDLAFALGELLEVGQLTRLPRYRDFSPEIGESVLEESARLAQDVLAPINRLGDLAGAQWQDGAVHMPPEFHSAYQRYVEGGWSLLSADVELGGQGAPLVWASAVDEIGVGANVAFSICPLLTRSAVEALRAVASEALQTMLLPRMISGEWTGTMNLTEPQAGSDLAAIRTRAVPHGEHYRLRGQKIFITYGEHDFTSNIIHLVLARIEGAPAGVKGISLFAVPKVLIGPDGSLGERNDVRCVSIEHKLGLHASPTCVMSYGDHAGALGYLLGEANYGLEYMFIMMNAARLGVGVQGVGLAELALQQARAWANERIQGRPIGVQGDGPFPIIHHPDVARLLLTMRANVEAMRALSLSAALELDRARAHGEDAARQAFLWRGELLIPIVKGWCTELAGAMASLAIQVHGGMGYIEDTGVAQTLRDARISSIYEGTTAIQANDLLGRKLGRDQGAAMATLLADWAGALDLAAEQASDPVLAGLVAGALESIALLRNSTGVLLRQAATRPRAALAVSVPYLMLCGRVLGGVLLARSAVIAARRLATDPADPAFYRAKLQTARFYIEQLLPEALGLARVVENSGAAVVDAAPELI